MLVWISCTRPIGDIWTIVKTAAVHSGIIFLTPKEKQTMCCPIQNLSTQNSFHRGSGDSNAIPATLASKERSTHVGTVTFTLTNRFVPSSIAVILCRVFQNAKGRKFDFWKKGGQNCDSIYTFFHSSIAFPYQLQFEIVYVGLKARLGFILFSPVCSFP